MSEGPQCQPSPSGYAVCLQVGDAHPLRYRCSPNRCGLHRVPYRVSRDARADLSGDQIGSSPDRCFGYLTEVPFLRPVPPQVQLDCLLQTWSRHISRDPFEADLADESVIYAACETAARVVSVEPQSAKRFLRNGPKEDHHDIDPRLADTLQAYHVNLPNEGDFLLISQFLDMPPDEALPVKRKFGMSLPSCEVMFDMLGRWHLSPGFAHNSVGLLTPTSCRGLCSYCNQSGHRCGLRAFCSTACRRMEADICKVLATARENPDTHSEVALVASLRLSQFETRHPPPERTRERRSVQTAPPPGSQTRL